MIFDRTAIWKVIFLESSTSPLVRSSFSGSGQVSGTGACSDLDSNSSTVKAALIAQTSAPGLAVTGYGIQNAGGSCNNTTGTDFSISVSGGGGAGAGQGAITITDKSTPGAACAFNSLTTYAVNPMNTEQTVTSPAPITLKHSAKGTSGGGTTAAHLPFRTVSFSAFASFDANSKATVGVSFSGKPRATQK
jgi:hypothetical protein